MNRRKVVIQYQTAWSDGRSYGGGDGPRPGGPQIQGFSDYTETFLVPA